MTKRGEIYKCYICTNVVETVMEGAGELVCCGQEMINLIQNEAKPGTAHYGNLTKIDDITYNVSYNHVATPEHHIEYIEAVSNDGKYLKRKYLSETETPEITFKCDCKAGFYMKLYCNLDGVWITRY